MFSTVQLMNAEHWFWRRTDPSLHSFSVTDPTALRTGRAVGHVRARQADHGPSLPGEPGTYIRGSRVDRRKREPHPELPTRAWLGPLRLRASRPAGRRPAWEWTGENSSGTGGAVATAPQDRHRPDFHSRWIGGDHTVRVEAEMIVLAALDSLSIP